MRGYVGVLLGILACAAVAQDASYRVGYLQALLDRQFSGLGVMVHSIEQERVSLSARTCLGASHKREIEQLVGHAGWVSGVDWAQNSDCDGTLPIPEIDSILDFEALPERELFAPLLADPRQPRFSTSYQYYKTPSATFNAASVAFGEYFGFASGFLGGSGASQIGIQAAVFALFNLDAPSSDLVNADYWVAIPISYRKGSWSYLARLFHQSSHLGDEFLLGNPTIDRVNLSYEELEFLASFEWERWRVYGGAGYVLNSEPNLEPWRVHGGVEFITAHAAGDFDLIAATDWRASQELDWHTSASFQVGFEMRRDSRRRLRIMLEYFYGHSPNGQFFVDRLSYTGLGLYFGF
jgi:hypothetical protein